jgi:hypothetical protein
MKVVLIAALVATLAVVAAGWKWNGHALGHHAQGQYKIAGWSWGDDGIVQGGDDLGKTGQAPQ